MLGHSIDINRRYINLPRNTLSKLLLKHHELDFEHAMMGPGDKPVFLRRDGIDQKLPSNRFVEEFLKSIPWLSTGKNYYGHYFSCGKGTQ